MRKTIFLMLFLGFLLSNLAFSQSISLNYQIPIPTKVLALDTVASIKQIQNLSDLRTFHGSENLGSARAKTNYWFEVDFSEFLENHPDLDSLIFYPVGIEKGNLFVWNQDHFDSLSLNRFEENVLLRSEFSGLNYVPIPVQNLFHGSKLFMRVNYIRISPNLTNKVFYSSTPQAHATFSQLVSRNSFKSQVLAYFFLGVAFVLLVFNLILFSYMKDRQYIYYGLFILFQLMYYSQISPTLAQVFGYHYSKFFFWMTTVSQVIINLTYLMFIRHFLDFKEKMPKFDRIVKGLAYGLCGFTLLMAVLVIINPYSRLQADLMNVERIFMATFTLFAVIYLWRNYPDNLVWFVISGTVIFTTGALCTMFLLDLDYMVAGSAVESIIFSFGLSYKIKAISSQKQKAEIEAYQTKLGALRAQINPHFIFNSLASIQHLISSGQNQAALRYLSKFSKFVHQVLENSLDIHITLEKEIELLKVYLDLESLRFDHAFSYEIEIDPDSNLDQEEVPMMIVQPFVENAIKHGLLPKKEGDRKLKIHFHECDLFIHCEVMDNGIGITASKANKTPNSRPSRGLMLTEERLKMAHKSIDREELIQFSDCHPGTKVLIKIPKL
ncbi:sensor histidine kinase [Algoriphagus sp. PAP.12]|uniref:sensor histidine kinase n=1 Tax=Algoriphagus sp. PAP.12 TaxID=2996678 RepID=UPI00227BDDC5|nr:histidine kinase [Algoriphagus sp. PAP.12]